MCTNIGHGHPKVIAAIAAQAEQLAYANPFMATEPRARLGAKLAEITPGDIDTFFFTNGGAEANENAIKLARFVTGRHKILARYRSYHGGDRRGDRLTGDPRRWAAEPGIPGVIRVMDPYHGIQRGWDSADEALANLEETIQLEGPEHDRGLHPGDGDRHERHPRAARRLSPGCPRDLRPPRDPHDRRRGDGGLRPHREMVRGRPLERGPRPHHHGQGADQRLRPARGARHATQVSPSTSTRGSSTAG